MTTVKLIATSPHENLEEFIVSTARISTDSRKSDVRQLLRYLFRHQHLSPFEFVSFVFEIECPIFVKNQIVRHRTAKLNERSLRYVEFEENFFRPSQNEGAIRFSGSNNRQSSVVGDDSMVREDFERIEKKLEDLFSEYRNLIQKGVANEVARFCLPLATMTKLRVSFDLRNLLNFLGLRLDKGAQEETRQVANQILNLIRPLVPNTIEVWEQYSLNAITITDLPRETVSTNEYKEMKEKIDRIRSV